MVLLHNLRRFVSIVIFFGLVLASAALFEVDGPWLGEEVRFQPRARFPQRISQHVLKDFGDWFGDRIGLRYLLIEAAVEYNVGLLRWPIARQVAFGRDGWLFWTDDADEDRAKMADFRGLLRFRPAQIAAISANVNALRDGLAACGIALRFVIIPNKQSIYGPLLGGDETTVRTRLDDLMDRLDAPARSTILDLRPALRAAARRAPLTIYPKTETHWNALGAFHAYRAILDELATQSPVPHLDLAVLDNFTIDQHPLSHGDLAMTLMLPSRFPDTDVVLHPASGMAPVQTEETSYLHATFRSVGAEGEGPMVVFGDSFAPSLAELLARHYGTVYVRPNIDFDLIAQVKPRVVLVEMVARGAKQLLYPLPGIEHMCPR
jgi:hypothetical protein